MLKLNHKRWQSLFVLSSVGALSALATQERPKITIPTQPDPQRPKITIPTQPAPAPDFAFSPKRPRLVVLLHGVTPKYEEDRDAAPGTSIHPRFYWGEDLIQALTGYPYEDQMKVVLPATGAGLRIRTIPRNEWDEHSKMLPVAQNDLAPVIVRTPLATENIANNSKEIEL